MGEQTRRIGRQQRGGTLDPQAWIIPVTCSITIIEQNNKDGGLLQSLKTLRRRETLLEMFLHQEIMF
jgi:hypothetical protein